jgi:SAM-dependent methyltransferase
MNQFAFTRDCPPLRALLARESALIAPRISREPDGVGTWLSPFPENTRALSTAALHLHLTGPETIQGPFHACASLWPIADSALSFVVLQHALDYALEPEELLAEAVRCMRGHGILVLSGFRSFSAARLSRGWKTQAPRWASASSWARACRALGLADIEIHRGAPLWPWLRADAENGWRRQLGEALPNLSSVYVLSARKRGMRARPTSVRANAGRGAVLEVAGMRRHGETE